MTASAPRHLLSLRDLAPAAWRDLLDGAERLAGAGAREPLLAGRRFGMVFFNPSLRTRTAFEVAAFDLGGHAVYLDVGGGLWRLETRDGVVMDGPEAEHVKEGFGVLGRMVDALGARVFAPMQDLAAEATDPDIHAIARASSVPLLNLESAMAHPHQGLADALTVRRRFGGARVRIAVTWAPHVKPLPLAVVQSALVAFAHEGHEIVLAHPKGFDVAPAALAAVRAIGAQSGATLEVTDDQVAAARGAQVVYAKSWGAPRHYGDPEAGRAAVAAHPGWMIDEDLMRATEGGVFMHCLPVRRGVVVADEVLDGPRSIVLDQGAARLDVQKATLCHVLGVSP